MQEPFRPLNGSFFSVRYDKSVYRFYSAEKKGCRFKSYSHHQMYYLVKTSHYGLEIYSDKHDEEGYYTFIKRVGRYPERGAENAYKSFINIHTIAESNDIEELEALAVMEYL